jgi:hypothetical protein
MPRATDATRRLRWTLVRGAIASILAALLFAPVMTVGWCHDAAAGGVSVCGSEARSLVGITAYGWLWLAVQATIIVATAAAVARARPRRPVR